MGGRRAEHRESARDVTRHRSARRYDGGMATHKSFSARQRGAAPAGVSHPRPGGLRLRLANFGVTRRSSNEVPPVLSGTPSMRQVDRHVIDRTLGHLPGIDGYGTRAATIGHRRRRPRLGSRNSWSPRYAGWLARRAQSPSVPRGWRRHALWGMSSSLNRARHRACRRAVGDGETRPETLRPDGNRGRVRTNRTPR